MKKILAVDDDPVIQKFVHDILTRNGYQVEIAIDGVQAMEKVRKFRPDLIILDVMMPHMNGYDVCRAIKVDSALKNIPIILLTSLDQEVQARFLSALGIEYLSKNCKTNELLSKIKFCLGPL